jgi:hypothetical protein
MLTLFSIPKAFVGHVGVIQENALRSWCRLPGCEVILVGKDPGVAEAAARNGARWLPDVAVNELGTPLLDSAFRLARESASHPVLCYVNADIVFMSDLLEAVRLVDFREFLIAGQRWNLDVTEPLDFDVPGWEERLRERVRRDGELYPPYGIDYFVFRKDGALGQMPPFAVGRPNWDNWFIYDARRRGAQVIDATAAVMAVHQNHGYAHVKQRKGPAWEGPEGDRNLSLAGGASRLLGLGDATHVFREGRIVRALDREHLWRRVVTIPTLHPWLTPVWKAARSLKRAVWRRAPEP